MDNTVNPLNLLALQWLEQRQQDPRGFDIGLLTQACQFASDYYQAITPLYVNSMLQQGLEMADELLNLNCDNNTIAASIVFPSIYYLGLEEEIIKKHLPIEVYSLARGVSKMDAVQQLNQQKNSGRADNLRKMCLAMVDNVRIVLIKLAEQLVILKHLRNGTSEQQQQIASQVMHIYAPLANRLGVGQMKWQMEDLAFRYLNNDEYRKISQALKMRRKDRETFIHNFIDNLNRILTDAGVHNAEISGRAKHIYSIFRKICRKQVDFSQIYDTSAVRILVRTIEDCYKALSIVHTSWRHVFSEFDDYIAKPKPNGYRSIHTVIISPENIHVEIQIRTYQMHEESELGVAAHWQYKENAGVKTSSYSEKINWLRHIMDWQREVTDPSNNLYHKIFEDRVYVFTPNGDVFDLETGATPLDFAYHIHTNLGHRCRGAKVNDIMTPLTHQLRTGDQVHIITGKEIAPSRDWLNPASHYLKTSAALQKVRSWFKRQEQEHYYNQGQALWEKLAKREGVPKNDAEKAVEFFKFKNLHELFIAIGSGSLGVVSVLNKIKHPEVEEIKKPLIVATKLPERTSQSQEGLQIEGVGNLLTQLARCCRPIPGDTILGYITKGRGISVHQQDCRNLQFILKKHPERLFKVTWGQNSLQNYPVEILIEAEDRSGLIRDISNVIATAHLSLLGLSTRVDKLENMAYIDLTIEIKSLSPLKKILIQLQQVSGVRRVQRS